MSCEAWVSPEGDIYEGDEYDTHFDIARRIFPKENNPELSCEEAGYVKFGTYPGYSVPAWIPNPSVYQEPNDAQRTAIRRLEEKSRKIISTRRL